MKRFRAEAGRGADCGVYALNNALQFFAPAAGPAFVFKDLYDIAKKQKIPKEGASRAKKKPPLTAHGDADGNFSLYVLRRALQTRGFKLRVQMHHKKGQFLNHMQIPRELSMRAKVALRINNDASGNGGERSCLKFLVLGRSTEKQRHWFSLVVFASGHGVILDPSVKRGRCFALSPAGLCQIAPWGILRIYEIIKCAL